MSNPKQKHLSASEIQRIHASCLASMNAVKYRMMEIYEADGWKTLGYKSFEDYVESVINNIGPVLN